MQRYEAPSKIKFTMSDIQLKITRHTKRQENTTHNETNPSTETDKLVDKDINTDIITIFHVQEARGKIEHIKYGHERYNKAPIQTSRDKKTHMRCKIY